VLRAKVVRVDRAARQWGADGPAWVGEAMLIALGRKAGGNGRQAPADEKLLRYVDGILNNWERDGHRRQLKSPAAQARARPGASTTMDESLPAPGESHLFHRPPKTKEDELWASILFDLRCQMDPATFDLWLKSSRLLEMVQTAEGTAHLVVTVCSPYAVNWLEHRLLHVVECAVRYRLKQEVSITFRPPESD
jgi:hypothetical protein